MCIVSRGVGFKQHVLTWQCPFFAPYFLSNCFLWGQIIINTGDNLLFSGEVNGLFYLYSMTGTRGIVLLSRSGLEGGVGLAGFYCSQY